MTRNCAIFLALKNRPRVYGPWLSHAIPTGVLMRDDAFIITSYRIFCKVSGDEVTAASGMQLKLWRKGG